MPNLCPAGALLDVWLRQQGLTRAAFASRLGVLRSVLWTWMFGRRTPHIDNASQIERLTGIPASMWASKAALRPEPSPPSKRRSVTEAAA